jgi:MFS family permease
VAALSEISRATAERVAPARLGRDFRWLIASSWTTNLGDGMALAAGPLLVASQTDQPFLVALAALLQRLPWLVFGLYAGALADRADRRLMVMVCDALRVLVLVVLSLAITTGEVSIHVLLVAMLLIGVAEVFSDSASRTILPMVVPRADLGLGATRA